MDLFSVLSGLFAFSPGWFCDPWSELHGGASLLSDVLVWGASAAMPLFLAAVLQHRGKRPRDGSRPKQSAGRDRYFQALIENALDIITVTDGEGTILYESPANQRILGYAPEETVGRNAFEFIHPEDRPRVRRVFEEGVREPGVTRSLEFRTRHKDGSWRIVEAIGRNLLHDPDVAAVIINARDITERCETEEALRQAHDELERRVQQRTAELQSANEALKAEIAERERAEEALAQQALRAQLLYRATTIAVETDSFDQALQHCIDIICEMTGWPVGHAYLAPSDGTDELVPTALWHCDDPQRYTEFRTVTEQTRFGPGAGLLGRIWKSGKPECIANVQTDHDFIRRDVVHRAGLKAAFGFPIHVCGQTVAVLEFLHVDEVVPADHLLTTVRIVGEQVGRVIERSHAAQALRESEARFRAITQHAAIGVALLDANRHCILGTNPAMERLLGYERDELLGKTLVELTEPDDVEPSIHLYEELLAGKRPPFQIEKRYRHQDGHIVWARKTVSTIPAENGRPRYIIGMMEDITRQKVSEGALHEANEDLQRKNEELEQFVYTVSHDLKSPLVTILGFIGLLKEELEDDLGEDRLDSFRRVERAAERMGETIDDLLQLSRIGRFCNEPEEVDVASLLEDLRKELQEPFEQRQAELDLQADLPPVVADRQRLRQAFENLLTNSLKYGCRGPDPRITIGSVTADGERRYFVRDNGPGISADYHERIFGLFQRLDAQSEGTGVGLALVAKIARIHGGRTWVESVPGEGATFWLAFPAQKPGFLKSI